MFYLHPVDRRNIKLDRGFYRPICEQRDIREFALLLWEGHSGLHLKFWQLLLHLEPFSCRLSMENLPAIPGRCGYKMIRDYTMTFWQDEKVLDGPLVQLLRAFRSEEHTSELQSQSNL